MAYGEKLTYVCANVSCGKEWQDLKSKARQCCSKECSEKVRIAKMQATKGDALVKEKIRASRVEKFGAWNPEGQGAEVAAARRAKNGGEYASAETKARLRDAQLALGRTAEERRASRLLVDEKAVAAKSRTTREERYGTWLPPSAVEKAAQTKIERYGAVMPPAHVEARKATMMERHGVEHALQIPGVAARVAASYDSAARAARANDSWYANQNPIYTDMMKLEWWETNHRNEKALAEICEEYGVSMSFCVRAAQLAGWEIRNSRGSSVIERRFASAIEALGLEVVANTKKIIGPQEIDIWIPSHSLAVEVNGLYWHSEEAGGKSKSYHADKMRSCEAQGIRLLQFWDSELTDNFDLCVAMVKAITGGNSKVGARQCVLGVVSSAHAKAFMTSNHLAGFRPGTHTGLWRDGALLAVATYGSSYFRKDCVELIRFASLQGVTVVGGFGKLIKAIPGTLVSYSDNRYSRGGVYAASGFRLDRDGAPTPWYTKDGVSLYHRSSIIKKAHPELTQRESAAKDGWLTVWDAGQRTWVRPSP